MVFASKKDRLLALIEYIDADAPKQEGIVVMDRVMGNAAALLSVKAGCREVYSPLGSELAVATLDKFAIRHHLSELVPIIQRDDRQGICPMEKLSMDKTPDEFYTLLKPLPDRLKASYFLTSPLYPPLLPRRGETPLSFYPPSLREGGQGDRQKLVIESKLSYSISYE